ncbi:aminopeptidase [Fulvitalea axinellae]|uniref:Aminopeptidase n=1 Tax=Fulvitalea axinellae TaxID=1182444 RepID=A0AAU9CRL1_9BACT|nr:aminopeptidase [Fulvitalea axinellae]
MELLRQLCAIHSPSGEEFRMAEFILKYVETHSSNWKTTPEIIHGDETQDMVILVFGKPRTAVYAHTDSIGFTVRYNDQLVPIGGPEAENGYILTGKDGLGDIECELTVDAEGRVRYRYSREIDRGTSLIFKPDFNENATVVRSPSLDNRLGVYNALKIAENLEHGALVFSTYEEHGGGTASVAARLLYERFGLKQALVSDVTWATDGVHIGEGVAVSLRDSGIPRYTFVKRILDIAKKSEIPYQLEVEASGGSDGRELQRSPYPVDWCFIGPPSADPHSPFETVSKKDIESMIGLYEILMREL